MKRTLYGLAAAALSGCLVMPAVAVADNANVNLKILNCTINPINIHWSGNNYRFDGETGHSGDIYIVGRDTQLHQLHTSFNKMSGSRCHVTISGDMPGEFTIKQTGWSDKALVIVDNTNQSRFFFDPPSVALSEDSTASLTLKIGCLR